MNYTFTLELCAEDRARLDRLAAALELRSGWIPQDTETTQTTQAPETPTEAAGTAETVTPINTPPIEKEPTEETTAPSEEVKPTVTLGQIQQKVMQLAAGQGGAKKAKVREIINAYGAKVSDLKDQPDKWTEIWDKLTALEMEA